MDLEFELVGIMIGLAIYNSHILEFQFPNVLFKRLMANPPPLGLEDLKEMHPDVYNSLSKLGSMDEAELSSLGLNFQADVDIGFGEMATVDLIPGGSLIQVNSSNKKEYILAYARHLLETSIEKQFSQFRSGFLRLCSGASLAWFKPEELELLICGSREVSRLLSRC
jgi:ubiquitin-protein ligase E3 A